MVGVGRLVGGHPVDADRDFGTEGVRLVDDHLRDVVHDWDHGFDTADDHLVGGRPADVVHDFDKAGDHLADAAHDFGMEDDHLVGGRLAGVVHDFDTDARPADLDCVAGLRVSRYRHHRARTSYEILPGLPLARAVGAGHGFDRVRAHLVEGHLEGVDRGFGKEHAHLVEVHLADVGHDFEMADDHLVGDHRRDAEPVGLQHDYQNYHRVGQRYMGVFHRRRGEHCCVAYECRDARHQHPSGH